MSEERSEPLYRHVYRTVLDRIIRGELGPGAMLPSETDLGAEFGVSQGTARKALGELVQDGILERHQGRGTFVATTTPERALFHFFRLRHLDGSAAYPAVESETIRKRRPEAIERAKFKSGEQVYQILRIRSIDGKLAAREVICLPVGLFPGLQERAPLPNALYPFYQKVYGIAIGRADETLTAAAADANIAADLGILAGSPVLSVARQALDLSGRCVEMRTSTYVTLNLHYEITLR